MQVPQLPGVRLPVLGLAAPSGTGKTTLLRALIPRLKAHGLRVGIIKHAHHGFDPDQPGKDSFLLRRAGACPLLIASAERRVIFFDHETPREPRLQEELAQLDARNLDLVLVEGFKDEAFAKIELYRPSLGASARFPWDPTILAVASDQGFSESQRPPILNLNDPDQIADWIRLIFLPAARHALAL